MAAAELDSLDDTFVSDLISYLPDAATVDELKDIYGQPGQGEIFAPAQTPPLAALRFTERLYSCPAIVNISF